MFSLICNNLLKINTLHPRGSTKAMSEKLALMKKCRYNGRAKKRQWEERRTDKGEVFDVKKLKPEGFERVKRRKYALLLGYSGTNYYGMQRNPGTRTIEEDLFKALLNAKFIDEDAYDQVQNIQYQRAARTDKGVSAARQVVSLKLPENIDIEEVNKHLPNIIRIFGIKRVTKGFNSKSQCSARTYMYMLPTIAFAQLDDKSSMEEYRLSNERLNTVRNLLKLYEGTKNYHNFTSKRKPNDPSCKRYIISFDCDDPIIRRGIEFAVLKVKGQSFMMHQIRKMVGLLLAVVRGHTTEKMLSDVFNLEKINIPRAPGLGLVLDYVHYTRYNNRYGNDGMHERLEWEEYDNQVNDFKEKYIYPTIIDNEIREKSMVMWLEKMYRHSYDPDAEDIGEDEDDGENSCDEKNDGVICRQHFDGVGCKENVIGVINNEKIQGNIEKLDCKEKINANSKEISIDSKEKTTIQCSEEFVK